MRCVYCSGSWSIIKRNKSIDHHKSSCNSSSSLQFSFYCFFRPLNFEYNINECYMSTHSPYLVLSSDHKLITASCIDVFCVLKWIVAHHNEEQLHQPPQFLIQLIMLTSILKTNRLFRLFLSFTFIYFDLRVRAGD